MVRCRNPPKRMLGFKVAYERLPSGYGGMNCRAAKDLKIPYPHPCSTIFIDPDQSCEAIRETIRHEAIETKLMQKAKLGYQKAHKITTEIEMSLKKNR